MVEDRVYNFVKQANRPFNTQGVADMLAQFGLKKTQVQKALDALSEAGKLLCKEFGKQKLYIPPQADLQVLSKEELAAARQNAKELSERLRTQTQEVDDLKKALADANLSLTAEQIASQSAELAEKVAKAEASLAKLQSGAVLVTAEQRAAVEKAFLASMDHWARRKRMFKNLWDQISENLDQSRAELFEEMGIETDESCDVNYAQYAQLVSKRVKR